MGKQYAVFAGEDRLSKWQWSKREAEVIMRSLAVDDMCLRDEDLVERKTSAEEAKEEEEKAKALGLACTKPDIRWVPTGKGWAVPALPKPKRKEKK